MKRITLFLLLHIGVVCTSATAKTLDVWIPHENILDTGFGNVTPIKYIVNQNGEVIFKKNGPTPNLIRKLVESNAIENSSEEVKKISRWLPADFAFSDAEFTIVLVRDDVYEGCPPCKKHEIRIRKIMEKLSDRNLAFVQLIQDLGANSKVEMISSEKMKTLLEAQKGN